MQTLKEISQDAVIKYGVGPRLNIPPELKEELERIETNIQRGMKVQNKSYHIRKGQSIYGPQSSFQT